MKKAHKKSDKQTVEFFQEGLESVYRHPIFCKLAREAHIRRDEQSAYSRDGLCIVSSGGYVYCNPHSKAAPEKWARPTADRASPSKCPAHVEPVVAFNLKIWEISMNGIIYLVGLVVVVMAVLSLIGLR